jgi:hypothetical protein
MARSGHGLPKVSPRPAMSYRSVPCGQNTPKMAVFYPFGDPTPYAYGKFGLISFPSLFPGAEMKGRILMGRGKVF